MSVLIYGVVNHFSSENTQTFNVVNMQRSQKI